MFICRQKIYLILPFFLEKLQRHCKLVILGTLGMTGYAHTKSYYQLVENFHVYLQVKNQLHPAYFSQDITKICQLILGTLGISGYAHPEWQYQLVENYNVYSPAEKTSSFTSFLRYYISKNPASSSINSNLAHNSKTRILPVVGLVAKYQ